MNQLFPFIITTAPLSLVLVLNYNIANHIELLTATILNKQLILILLDVNKVSICLRQSERRFKYFVVAMRVRLRDNLLINGKYRYFVEIINLMVIS